MKFGDKIYTYKDIEEAKKLIGKKVIGSDYLDCIERDYERVLDKGVLTSVDSNSGSFEIDHRYTFQFIREVIDEPSYRPFKDVAELVEYWEKNYTDKKRPNGTMPFIWVKAKISEEICLITGYRQNDNSVWVFEEYKTMEELFNELTFLNNEPCGVEVTE